MSVLTPERAREIAAGWRTSTEPTDGFDNPAGDLYASGAFAEADIIALEVPLSATRSLCTGSCTVHCCA